MNEELQHELAKFFVAAWSLYINNPSEDLQELVEGTDLVEEVVATAEDIEKEIASEGCEEGDTFYVLSALGIEAWNLVKGKDET